MIKKWINSIMENWKSRDFVLYPLCPTFYSVPLILFDRWIHGYAKFLFRGKPIERKSFQIYFTSYIYHIPKCMRALNWKSNEKVKWKYWDRPTKYQQNSNTYQLKGFVRFKHLNMLCISLEMLWTDSRPKKTNSPQNNIKRHTFTFDIRYRTHRTYHMWCMKIGINKKKTRPNEMRCIFWSLADFDDDQRSQIICRIEEKEGKRQWNSFLPPANEINSFKCSDENFMEL